MTNQKEGRMKIEERDEKPNGDKKKSILYGMLFKKDWRRPTFPQINAVSSAMTGLTSLFGMGRGEHRLHNHQNMVLWVLVIATADYWQETYKSNTESLRVISTARLCRCRLYTCSLSRS